MRIVTVIIGILLIIAGFISFANLGITIWMMALFAGIAILVFGINQIGNWFTARKTGGVSGWVLAEGIITSILGIIIIFYPISSLAILAIWVAAWLVVSGVMRIIAAIQTRKNLPGSSWGVMLFLGIIITIVGICGIIFPLTFEVAMAIMLGIFFIIQGINLIVYGVSLPGMKNMRQ